MIKHAKVGEAKEKSQTRNQDAVRLETEETMETGTNEMVQTLF